METEPKRWRIGAWEFNVSSRTLQRDGCKKRLGQNEGRLLTFLIRNFSDEPQYTNEEIKHQVWQGTYVEKDSLYKAASNLAKILEAKEGEYLGNRPYRLVRKPIPTRPKNVGAVKKAPRRLPDK